MMRILAPLLIVCAIAAPAAGEARTLGLAADNSSKSAIVFDADTGEVLATIPLPTQPFDALGDTAVLSDQSLGFVTNFANQIFVIDLQASPPRLADGTNPILISNTGLDLSVSSDERFLVISGARFLDQVSLSVVDIAGRVEVSAPDPTLDSALGVEVCGDGSVLVAFDRESGVRRFLVDSSGSLIATGEMLPALAAFNVSCAPDDRFGLAVVGFGDSVQSFSVPGLSAVAKERVPRPLALSGIFQPSGDRIYVRSDDFSTGRIDVFPYDAATGAIGPVLQTRAIDGALTFVGVDQVAIHPDGTRLYVPQRGRIDVLSADNLELQSSITAPGIVQPTGIALPTRIAALQIQVAIDIKPGPEIAPINLKSGGVIPVAILGSDTLDVQTIDVTTLRFGPGEATPGSGIEVTDSNADGINDLIVRFRTQASGIQRGDMEACLSGSTVDGTMLSGCDAIQIVPKAK